MTVTYFLLSHFLPAFMLGFCFSEKNQRSSERTSHRLPPPLPSIYLPAQTQPSWLCVDGSPVLTLSETSPAPVLSSSNFLSRISLIFQTLLDHSQQHTNVLLFSHHKTNLKNPPFSTDFFVDYCLFLCSPLQQNIATRVFCTRSLVIPSF